MLSQKRFIFENVFTDGLNLHLVFTDDNSFGITRYSVTEKLICPFPGMVSFTVKPLTFASKCKRSDIDTSQFGRKVKEISNLSSHILYAVEIEVKTVPNSLITTPNFNRLFLLLVT